MKNVVPYDERFRRFMLYWGLDGNEPTINTDRPILTIGNKSMLSEFFDITEFSSKYDKLLFEYTHKQTGIVAIYRSYADCLAFALGDDPITIQAREDFYQEYLRLWRELNDLYWGAACDCDDAQDLHCFVDPTEDGYTFAERVSSFSNTTALKRFNKIYDKWQETMDNLFIDNLCDFADKMITSWYYDCVDFIFGDDEEAEKAKEKLEEDWIGLLRGIMDIEFCGDYAAYTFRMTQHIDYSISVLDQRFYKWQVGSLKDELKESRDDALDRTKSKSVRSKINKVYNDAIKTINEAEKKHTDWKLLSHFVEDITTITTVEIEQLNEKWRAQRYTTIWASASSSIGVVAIAIIVVVVILMNRRVKKYTTILYGDDANIKARRKDKKLEKQAEELAEKTRIEREKRDSIIEIEKKRAEEILRMKKERDRILAELTGKEAKLEEKEIELKNKNLQIQKSAEVLDAMNKKAHRKNTSE